MPIFFLICLETSASAQNNRVEKLFDNNIIDSLKYTLSLAKNDSVRITILENIGYSYEVSNIDSSLKYSQAALTLARQRGYAWGEARMLASLSGVMRQQGQFAEALDLLFMALKIAEENNIVKEIARCNRRLGLVYFDLENFSTALKYYQQAVKIDEKMPDNGYVSTIDHMILGKVYERLDKLDSASFHSGIALKKIHLYESLAQQVYLTFGDIQLKRGDYDHAKTFYRKGLNASLKNNDLRTASESCVNIAGMFAGLNKKDSAIYYATVGYEYGQSISYRKGVMLAAGILADLYNSEQPVNALKYYKIANAAKDSLYGMNSLQTIQHLVSREEARRKDLETARISFQNRLKLYSLLTGSGVFLVIALILYRNNLQKQKANILLHLQKEEIQNTLTQLKSTQSQLIQTEKMASLGELTAGIAHEIQNPLNFVNNFSEVSQELVTELKEELIHGDLEEAKSISDDVIQNLLKIKHHGQRASDIVKGMLQHSRSSSGEKEPVDINALADEYLRLAYHGLRAKDKSFNATLNTNYDHTIGKINVVPQDIGRVILNLINNAFYAATEKKKQAGDGFEPTVSVNTKKADGKVLLSVQDNGYGIPDSIKEKIFQPFFTTKPTGQGTGLGLSLSYDIVKAHGGQLTVKTVEGEGSEFIVQLPV